MLLRDPATGQGVALWVDASHSWLQVFTGDALPAHARESLAVEPMTAPSNAFSTGEGLVMLAPAGYRRRRALGLLGHPRPLTRRFWRTNPR